MRNGEEECKLLLWTKGFCCERESWSIYQTLEEYLLYDLLWGDQRGTSVSLAALYSSCFLVEFFFWGGEQQRPYSGLFAEDKPPNKTLLQTDPAAEEGGKKKNH